MSLHSWRYARIVVQGFPFECLRSTVDASFFSGTCHNFYTGQKYVLESNVVSRSSLVIYCMWTLSINRCDIVSCPRQYTPRLDFISKMFPSSLLLIVSLLVSANWACNDNGTPDYERMNMEHQVSFGNFYPHTYNGYWWPSSYLYQTPPRFTGKFVLLF